MQTTLLVFGALAIIGLLVGFFRSFWQSPPKPADAADSLRGMSNTDGGAGHHTDSGGADGGGH